MALEDSRAFAELLRNWLINNVNNNSEIKSEFFPGDAMGNFYQMKKRLRFCFCLWKKKPPLK
jgi:hypothetical protein